jgi:topoisomerase-4 subunit B
MAPSYTASDIEVLEGLEPVRRRPGMYTDTRSPNHLVHEVVDNSVDEALSGHCTRIDVTVHKDGSVSVEDDGRGMPVDIHPKEKVSGVELILTRLHAGGKFSDRNYESAGGLHGVGVSVVNALSKHLECNVRRDGREWNIGFRNGKVVSKLEAVGKAKKGETGTTVRFWPDPEFFDTPNVSVTRLKHVLKAKAVLCPGLRVKLAVEATGEAEEWYFTGDLGAYLLEQLGKVERLPEEPYAAKVKGGSESADWAFCWAPDDATPETESNVNLNPTPDGRTHDNGLR